MSRNVIPYYLTDESNESPAVSCLPISSARELADVEQLSSHLGFSLQRIAPSASDENLTFPKMSHCGAVTGLRRHAPLIRLYANLTGRSHVIVDSLSPFQRLAEAEVLVTTSDHLSPELLRQLYDPNLARSAVPRKSVPGIITGLTEADLRLQLMKSALFLLDGDRSWPQRLDIVPELRISNFVSESDEIIGNTASKESLETAMRKPLGLINITTHSDGIDLKLTSAHTLCPISSMHRSAYFSAPPRCIKTGVCHRHEMPLEEAIASNHTMGCDGLVVKIALLNTCNGVVFPNGPVDQEWGLVFAMIRSSCVGALITHWGVVITDAMESRGVADRLAEGVAAGHAVFEFNKNHNYKKSHLCLLGDPAIRLPKTGDGKQVRVPPPSRGAMVPIQGMPEESYAELNYPPDFLLLRRAIENVVRNGALEPGNCLGRVLDVLRREERHPKIGGEVKVQRLFMSHLKNNSAFVSAWVSLARVSDATYRKCGYCGESLTALRCRFDMPAVNDRRLCICPRCGVTEDLPANLDLNIEIGRSDVRASFPEREGRWDGAVVFWAYKRKYSIVQDWPLDRGGLPLARWTQDDARVTLPLSKCAIIMCDFQYAYFARLLGPPR